jgi:hypothetical protein
MTELLKYIAQQVVYGVRWDFVFYILFGLFSLGVLVRWVKLSPIHIAIEIFKEILGALGLKGMTRTNIDGAVTISFVFFSLLALLSAKMQELPDFLAFLAIFRRGVESQEQSLLLFLFMVFMTLFTMIVSLILTRRE